MTVKSLHIACTGCIFGSRMKKGGNALLSIVPYSDGGSSSVYGRSAPVCAAASSTSDSASFFH